MTNSLNRVVPNLRTPLIILFLVTLLFIVFSVWQLLKKADDSVTLNQLNIASQFSYLVDEKASLTIDSLNSSPQKFIQTSQKNIPFKLGHSAYWVKVILENSSSTDQEIILHINNTLLSEFDVYQQVNNDKKTDQYTPFKNSKDISQQTFPHIALNITGLSNQTLLLRIKTLGPPSVPLILHTIESFDNHKQVSLLIFGGFIAIILLMSVYNLVIYRMIRDKVFLVYTGYLLAAFFVLSSLNGFGYLLFSQDVQSWLNNYLLSFNYLLAIFLLLFALYFLRYDHHKSKLYKLGIGLCLMLAVSLIVTLPLNQVLQTQIFFSFQPLIYLYSFFIVSRRLRSDFSWARFYFLSWIAILTTATIQPLVMLNYIDYSFIIHNAFIFGVIIEISFMSLALAERMRRNEQDRIFELSYHLETQLPRKSTLENVINQASLSAHSQLSVVVIKPEQIERLGLYSDEQVIHQLFISLNKHLSSLFTHNDAILELTNKHEKICYFENDKCLAIIINENKNTQAFNVIVKSIQEITTENYQISQLNLPLTALVGIASTRYNDIAYSAQEVMNHAKLALSKAENTPVKWALYQENKSIKEDSLLTIALEMKKAIRNNNFEVYHQPQIDLKTLRVCGSECLIRWHHQTLGSIPPTVFIPIAEDLGLINQITLWIIEQALAQQNIIGEDKKCNHMISINISPKDIISKQFYKNVVEIITTSEISPDKIIFQLTESSTITDNSYALQVIEQLIEFGITLSIDDFTTGYSSMAHIDELPFQELKIGRHFVENIFDDNKRKIVTETTVKMAKGLGLEVVAEGINSQLDEETLRKFGCDIGQGYHYSMPLPLNEYMQWLSAQVNGKTPKHFYGEFIPADKADS